MEEPNIKPRIFPKIFWSVLVIILILFGALFAKAYNFSSKIFTNHTSFFKRVSQLAFSHGNTTLTGESAGQINILMLGYGGPGHDGPYLTDSIILASIKPATKEVLLTSIPRDYLWKKTATGSHKINEAFNDGLGGKIDYDSGGARARQAVADLSGLDIPYYTSMDFQGFVDAINRIGGIDVTVDRSFTDSQFPNDINTGYLPTQTFNAGPDHMNGTRALIFARSRHGSNNEDSDFARSKRQEKILSAFRDKINSLNVFSNSSIFNDLLNILADHFHTNIEPDQLLHLANMLHSGDFKIVSQSIDQDSGLVCPKITDDGIFVLMPCVGVSTAQIQNLFKNGFEDAGISSEHASIIVEDTGSNTQLYKSIVQTLQSAGVTVFEVPYKKGIPLTVSAFYEVNSKPLTEKLIENKLGIAHQPKPAKLVANADLVLFVGGAQ